MELLIGAIGTALVGLIGVLGKVIVDLRKEKHSQDSDHVRQAVTIYKELVEGLKKDVAAQQKDLEAIEKSHLNCREECAILKTQNNYLTQQIRLLSDEINVLKTKLAEFSS